MVRRGMAGMVAHHSRPQQYRARHVWATPSHYLAELEIHEQYLVNPIEDNRLS